jgi:hypothetical protein
MEKPLLNDPAIPPDGEQLRSILGESYEVYDEMMETITAPECGLAPEWRYYNDGKAWLCKVVFKKKTVFWLSVWDRFFKVSFYFAGRHCPDVAELDIDPAIKENLSEAKPFGTLFPVTMEMKRKEQIADLIRLVEYKKKLK